MKKAKRFLTGLLSAALALSLCAMPAMAEGEGDTQTSEIKTSVSTIDESKTGSITIHKYLQKDAKENNDGTGEDNQTAPTGAEAAEGVGFTVYQVMSKADLLNYYNGKGDTVTIDTYADVNKNELQKGVTPIKTYEKKTGKDGVVKFDNLEIGLYVVIETYKPASVTQAVKPFLVSIPMTRKGDVKKGEEWLYDVVVYPKNSTTTGNFNLVKYGVIGNDRDNKTALEGVKFRLEHLKDGVEFNTEDAKNPENWELITPKAVEGQPAKKYFVTNDAGKISVNDLKPGTYRFTEIGYEDGKDNKYIINENDQYVFVVDKTGTSATIPEQYTEHTDDYTVNGNTVSVYNYVPDVDKKVNKNGTWQEAADYSVGDSINYKIDVTIPENIERLKTFTVTDTPTGLTDNVNTVVVKDGNTAIANDNNSVYEVKKNGDDGFIVEFVPSAMAAYKGKTLTITYTAVLKDSAVTKTEGNPNKVKLNYSKNVKQDEKPDTDEDKKTVQDEAVVYTFKIHIDKIADDGKQTPLEGVEFDLYKQVDHGTAGAITDAKAKALGLDETKGWVKVNEEALKTNSEGILEVKGLENGTYKLVETKAKDGYNLLKAPVDVSLDIAYKTTWTETNHYENGVWVKRDVTVKNEKFDAKEGTNGGKQNGSKDGDGVISTTIINRKGFDLPTTGGFGTLLFSGIGVLLVVAGVGVLLSLKKKNRA